MSWEIFLEAFLMEKKENNLNWPHAEASHPLRQYLPALLRVSLELCIRLPSLAPSPLAPSSSAGPPSFSASRSRCRRRCCRLPSFSLSSPSSSLPPTPPRCSRCQIGILLCSSWRACLGLGGGVEKVKKLKKTGLVYERFAICMAIKPAI